MRFRPKILNQDLEESWGNWMFIPAEGYVEFERFGPIRISDLEWLDIDPIEVKRIGRLVPDRRIDHSDVLLQLLSQVNQPFEKYGGKIRLKF